MHSFENTLRGVDNEQGQPSPSRERQGHRLTLAIQETEASEMKTLLKDSTLRILRHYANHFWKKARAIERRIKTGVVA